ncbi:MAG: ABC transporter ATP-binding protein [Verrucomicrobiales bacterium]
MSELSAIEVKNLSKRYQLGTIGATTLRDSLVRLARRVRNGRAETTVSEEFWALRDVSFNVARGEVLGIIGKNGAGKSTLLKVLSRITDPTEGEAIIRGRVASLLEVGTGFHPELTGRENTYLNGAILGMRKREIDEKLEAISEFAGVEKFMDTPAKRYSSGMRVRLAFAVAAHLDPDILIIDEVLAVGDAAFQQKCLGKIGEVAESGRTVLFVSHNMAAIQSFCSRVLVIEGGTVAFDGSPSDGVERYYSGLTELRTTGEYRRTRPIPDTAPAWVTSARLITKRDSETAELNTGDPLSFEVAVTARTPLPGLVVGIGIENVRGVRVCTFHTKCDPQFEVEGSAGDYLFRCDVGEVGLAGGVYHVRIQIETGNESVELIESAFTFLLLSTDYFKNGGRLVGGAILVPQRWSLQRPTDRRLAEDDVRACSLSS